ncbi:PDZ domain-containing protein [uncultured Brevundimonas sp.]|uniref:S41 family peptidase n=1 Tax=uncultured Brevundimonas sp. TaxID=213418 RepID=UPI00262E3C17|nr:PDZ domain-containing protein [uncultured Brevundimonas sp.]
MARFLVCTAFAASLVFIPAAVLAQSVEQFRDDALSIDRLIDENYAYLDRFTGGKAPSSERLSSEAARVTDGGTLLRYAERRLASLADHHAITGSSFSNSWALVPSYSDLWIEHDGERFVVTAVRDDSPASQAGIKVGDAVLEIGGRSTTLAVQDFWNDLGMDIPPDGLGFAARVLAAGRRDSARTLTLTSGHDNPRTVTLASLYAENRPARDALSVSRGADGLTIRINDSLGDQATIAAFDAAMAQADQGETVILDLRDTPSGGNTVIARALMGWFVTEARPYQMHRNVAEERRTSIPRQWIEQVLPREGKHHDGPVKVLVGRWTGSMGEGLAVGFDALGAQVRGCPMAGLLGAIYDYRLEHSGLVIKLPAERLSSVSGTPREHFTCAPL